MEIGGLGEALDPIGGKPVVHKGGGVQHFCNYLLCPEYKDKLLYLRMSWENKPSPDQTIKSKNNLERQLYSKQSLFFCN